MNTDQVIRTFQKFLNTSWESIESILSNSSDERETTLADWFQANWECLVETSLCHEAECFLEIYGDGAECNGNSSRVWNPNILPTHEIYCHTNAHQTIIDILSNKEVTHIEQFSFSQFLSWNGKHYGSSAPFDYALLENDKNEIIIEVKHIIFDLRKISK